MQKQEIISIIGIISLIGIISFLTKHQDANALWYASSPLTMTSNATMVPEDGITITNSGTGVSCPSTSYTKSIASTTSSIRVGTSVADTCQRAYFEFNTAELPTDATITDTVLTFQVTAVSNAINCDIYQLTTDAEGAVASTVWTDIGDGDNYLSNSNQCTTTGSKSIDLGATADSDVQSSITSHWFGVGIKSNSETMGITLHTTTIAMTENSNSTIRPKLVVTYTKGIQTVAVLTGTDMTKDGAIVSNSATGSACPTTSYSTTSTTATTANINIGASGSSASCARVYFQYDVTGITDGATSLAELIFEDAYGAGSGGQNCDTYAMTTKPSTATALQVFTDAGDGTQYIANSAYCGTTYTSSSAHDLELGSSARSDFISSLANDWFAIGYKFNSETRDASAHTSVFQMSESTTSTPRIIAKYTMAKSLSDTITSTENRLLGINKPLSDTIAIAENRLSSVGKVLDDIMYIGETRIFGISTTINEDPLYIGETRLMNVNKVLNDNIAMTEDGIKNIVKVLNDDISIVESLMTNGIITATFSDFVILMDNLETDQENGGIDWGMFAGLAIVIPMIILLPIVAIKRRRR